MKLGFLGTGKITSAVVTGLCTSSIDEIKIILSPRNEERGEALENRFKNVKRATSNQQVIDESEIIFLALRPADAKPALTRLEFRNDQFIISLIPYLKMNELSEILNPAQNISRAVPLPSVINHNSPIPIYNSSVTVTEIFSFLGEPLLVDDENKLHVLWSLTGLIAPFYDLLGTLSGWAESKGIDKDIASKYLTDLYQSVLVTTQKSTPIDFNEIVQDASTPGGMNERTKKEIASKNSNDAYIAAAENLLKLFD